MKRRAKLRAQSWSTRVRLLDDGNCVGVVIARNGRTMDQTKPFPSKEFDKAARAARDLLQELRAQEVR